MGTTTDDDRKLTPTESVVLDLFDERVQQDAKWGEQNHPDGTGTGMQNRAAIARNQCDQAFASGNGTWRHILDEEVAEAFAEDDPERLRAELVQVAAVAVSWIEAIDRRLTRP